MHEPEIQLSPELLAQYEKIKKYKDAPAQMELLDRLLKRASQEGEDLTAEELGRLVGKGAGTVRQCLGDLRRTLEDYYRQAGTDATIIFEVPKNHCRVTYRPLGMTAAAHRPHLHHSALSINPIWSDDHISELMSNAKEGSELRLYTSGFPAMRPTLARIHDALNKGAMVKILFMDPDSEVFRARFRLWPKDDGWTFAEIKKERKEHYGHLSNVAKQQHKGSLKVELCDAMPLGYFLQGDAKDYGQYMIIGLMMATSTYSDGPMIEVRPGHADLWDRLDRSWRATWSHPRDKKRSANVNRKKSR